MLQFGIIAIQNQVLLKPLLTNLFLLWGIFYVFLKTKPATNFDWNAVALFGMAMLVGFKFS
jgi:hypothetical protein